MSWKQVRHPQSRYQPRVPRCLPNSCVAPQTADVFVSRLQNRRARRFSSRRIHLSARAEGRISRRGGVGLVCLTLPRKARMIWVYRCLDLPD